jgi:hypothetical protein
LIENRQKIKWDGDWAASGCIVWHIDLQAGVQTTRGYPGSAGWPAKHYMAAIVQADGLFEIEKGISRGNAGDFWAKGKTLQDSDTVFPNTASYQGGTLKRTGVQIEFLNDSSSIMMFRVSGLQGAAPRAPILSPLDVYPESDRTEFENDQVPHGGTSSEDLEEISDQVQIENEVDADMGTGSTTTWVLSILGGVATAMGLLAIAL